jgi:hypothetical protein
LSILFKIRQSYRRTSESLSLISKEVITYFFGDGCQTASLIRFTPLLISIYIFILLNFKYIYDECLPIESDSIKEAYSALKHHPFLVSCLQFFGVIIALIIGYHRSLISQQQVTLQRNSNNISNFYSIKEHIISDLESNLTPKLIEKSLSISKDQVFRSLFTDPSEGNYHPKIYLTTDIRSIHLSVEKIIDNLKLLMELMHYLPNKNLTSTNYYSSDNKDNKLINIIKSISALCENNSDSINITKTLLREVEHNRTLFINYTQTIGLNYKKSSTLDTLDQIDIVCYTLESLVALISSIPIDTNSKIEFHNSLSSGVLYKLRFLIDDIEEHIFTGTDQ